MEIMFQTVILSSGLRSATGPVDEIRNAVSRVEILGGAREVQDIFNAVRSGYKLAQKY